MTDSICDCSKVKGRRLYERYQSWAGGPLFKDLSDSQKRCWIMTALNKIAASKPLEDNDSISLACSEVFKEIPKKIEIKKLPDKTIKVTRIKNNVKIRRLSPKRLNGIVCLDADGKPIYE